jgi:hypothetical protein
MPAGAPGREHGSDQDAAPSGPLPAPGAAGLAPDAGPGPAGCGGQACQGFTFNHQLTRNLRSELTICLVVRISCCCGSIQIINSKMIIILK